LETPIPDLPETISRPTLSVALIFRDERAHLPTALTAIAAQADLAVELIAVDDGSVDGGMDLVRAQAPNLPPLVAVSHDSPRGTVACLNAAISRARGTCIHFAAADDVVLPGLYRRSLFLLAAHPNAALCSTRSRLIDGSGADLGLFRTPAPRRSPGHVSPEQCRRCLRKSGNWFMGNTAIFRIDALRSIGGFDPQLEGFSDAFACWTLALRDGACFDPEPLGVKRSIETGMGSTLMADPVRAWQVWRHARDRLSSEFPYLFDRGLLARLDRRWRYNIVRNRLGRLIISARAPKWQRLIRRFVFVLVRTAVAAWIKPLDLPAVIRIRTLG
jgi:glycosyltransferase involved in cell wall biosynthesis